MLGPVLSHKIISIIHLTAGDRGDTLCFQSAKTNEGKIGGNGELAAVLLSLMVKMSGLIKSEAQSLVSSSENRVRL